MNIEKSAVRILDYFRRHAAGSPPFCMHISSSNPGYHVTPQDCHVVVPSLVVKATDDDAGFLGRRTVLERPELKHLCVVERKFSCKSP